MKTAQWTETHDAGNSLCTQPTSKQTNHRGRFPQHTLLSRHPFRTIFPILQTRSTPTTKDNAQFKQPRQNRAGMFAQIRVVCFRLYFE